MLSQQPEADALLDRDPLALVIGMVLDQQVPLEKAFSSPYVLAERLGHVPDAAEIAAMPEDDLVAIFSKPPALHRFPGSMAKRVQATCRVLVDQYDGTSANLWAGVGSGAQLRDRIAALPGFGAQKAAIFTALLGKQYGVAPDGWREAAGPYGEQGSFRSVADQYDNDVTRIWTEATDGRDLLRRVGALPGFGKQKAQIFVALLGKQYGVDVAGWREAAGDYGPDGTYKSVADIRDADSLARVRDYKKQVKAAAKAGS